MSAKIVIEHLSKTFERADQDFCALDDISLTVQDGEFVSIVGPSGCGKTTLLRIMAGLEMPSHGRIETHRSGASTGPINSMVFQEHSLYPWLRVIDNVAFGLEMRGIPKAERHERANTLLQMVGLAKFSHYFPGQLSGGMKQRVSIARAFANDPEVLLMDEPLAALDAQNKVLVQDELLRLWAIMKKTVVYITHSIDEALLLGDRVVIMGALPGRIKEVLEVPFGRPRDLIEIRGQQAFSEISVRIWHTLEAEVLRARTLDLS
jgi:NitT/TauT family transport system ATP-binding protein